MERFGVVVAMIKKVVLITVISFLAMVFLYLRIFGESGREPSGPVLFGDNQHLSSQSNTDFSSTGKSIVKKYCQEILKYSFDSTANFLMNTEISRGGQQNGNLSIQADMVVTFVRFDGYKILLKYEIRFDNGIEPYQIYAEYDHSFKLIKLYAPESSDFAALDTVKSIVSLFQFSRNEDKKPYVAYETLSQGYGKIVYTQLNEKSYRKKIQKILPPAYQGSIRIEVMESDTAILLDDDLMIRSFEGMESFRVAMGTADSITSGSKYRYILTSKSYRGDSVDCSTSSIQSFIDKNGLIEIAIPPSGKNKVSNNVKKHSLSLPSVLDELKSLLAKNEESKEARETVNDRMYMVTMYLRSNPDELELIENTLINNLDNYRYASTLIGLVGGVDTQESQKFMLSIMKSLRGKQSELFIVAARTHVFAQNPSAENIQFLLEAYDDFGDESLEREASLLSAGAAASVVKERSMKEFVVDFVSQKIKDSNSLKEKVVAISALGNVADGECYSLLAESLNDKDEVIRHFAIQAMGSVPGGDAENSLKSIIMNSSISPADRKAAITAFFKRDIDYQVFSQLGQYYLDNRNSEKLVENLAASLLDRLISSRYGVFYEDFSLVRKLQREKSLLGYEKDILNKRFGGKE